MSGNDRPSEQLSDRAIKGEPVVDTPMLNALEQADLPLRGEFRKNVVRRMRDNIRSRRTVEGMASRISSLAVAPLSEAMEREVENKVRDGVVSGVKRMRNNNRNQ